MVEWKPILSGVSEVAARTAIRDIADALAAGAGESASETIDIPLFWAYLAGTSAGEVGPRYPAAVDRMAARIADGFASFALYGGIAGAGWVVAHLAGERDECEEADRDEVGAADFLALVDRKLLDALAAKRWDGDYDLISGLCGLGLYFLERLDQSADAAQAGLARIVDHLESSCEPGRPGLTWRTPAELLPEWPRDAYPDGCYNVGLAHGVPGIAALLARIARSSADSPRVRELLNGATEWIFAQYEERDNCVGFPHIVLGPGSSRGRGTRAAWCYGDPGVSIALFGAGRLAGELRWEQAATAFARQCARRPEDTFRVVDAGLCHGSAGLGHLFNRFYQATGDPIFQKTAQSWLARTLEMRQPGRGIAGYAARCVVRGEARWEAKRGLLEGIAGIGLALLSAVEPIEPTWDRLLLCDLPA